MTLKLAPADSISEEQARQRVVLHAKKQIGGTEAPVNYSFDERVFSSNDTPKDKALAKQEVLESLKSRVLASDKPSWNTSTSNYDNMQMTGKCYKRTNVNAERNRAHMYVYDFRAEKLPKKHPTLKPKTNRFNMGILEVALGDGRMAKGIGKRTKELSNHPDLRDAEPWNLSSELTPSTRKQHFLKIEAEREANSSKWKQKVAGQPVTSGGNYKTLKQPTNELNERLRQEKEAARLSATMSRNQHHGNQTHGCAYAPESLVLRGAPIFTGRTLDPSKRAETSSSGGDGVHKSDSISRIEDILNAILPPQMRREEDTGYWMRYAAPVPSTRFDVIKLQEEVDNKLMKRQVCENGICPVREDVYRQCYDELIREVATNCSERGPLLLRVRDEIRLATDAYKTLYNSSITLGVRKQLQVEDDMGDLQKRIEQLARDKQEHESKVLELTNKLKLIEKRTTERKALQDKKFEEIDFLKYQGQHLDAFLKSASDGSSSSAGSASAASGGAK